MSPRFGAYGLHLPDVSDVRSLVSAPEQWPTWRFDWVSAIPDGPQSFSTDYAELNVAPAGRARIDRIGRRTELALPSRYDEPALLHPLLGTTAVTVAAWSGLVSLHAGSFVHAGRVWGVLGEREDGKSSTLAWLIGHEFDIVADDLLITDGATVRSGPRFIDLRAESAERFGLGTDIGVVGTRRRWRVELGPLAAELPFAGWIRLAWGAAVDVARIDPVERIDVLAAHRGLRLPTDDARAMLGVLARPAFRFTRPRDFDRLDEAMAILLGTLDQH